MRRALALLLLLPVLLGGCGKEETATDTAPVNTERSITTSDSAELKTAETTRVVVHVTGFCTFIDKLKQPEGGKLMPFGLHVLDARANNHVPVVIYQDRFEKTNPTDRPVRKEKKQILFELLGERLFMKGVDVAANPLTYGEAIQNCPLPNTPNGTLAVVPRLKNLIALDGQGQPTLTLDDLDPDYVDPTMKKARIAAWTDVSFGILRSRSLRPIMWNFEPERGTAPAHRQMIAQEVEWSFDIPGTELTIESTPIESADAPKALVTLQAKKIGNKNVIHFTIANVIGTDVKILLDSALTHRPLPLDEHFPMYYDYLMPKPAPKDRPRPVAGGVCKGIGVSKNPCDMKLHLLLTPEPVCNFNPPQALGGLNCGPDRLP